MFRQCKGLFVPILFFMGKFIDLTGRKFTYLTVIERLPNTKTGQAVWLCKCDCGNIKKATAHNLKQDNVRSCGCYFNIGGTTHGFSEFKGKNKPEYNAWRSMKRRCAENNKRSHKNYFARGIKVCDEWVNSFIDFYNHIGKRPSNKHSIDRINNNGNYEPNNVRWAISKVQSRNKTSNVLIMHDGKNKILKDLADDIGISHDTLRYHLKKGRPIEQIVAHVDYNKKNNLIFSRWKQ